MKDDGTDQDQLSLPNCCWHLSSFLKLLALFLYSCWQIEMCILIKNKRNVCAEWRRMTVLEL